MDENTGSVLKEMEYLLWVWRETTDRRLKAHIIISEMKWENWEI